jgi:pyridoxine kinase
MVQKRIAAIHDISGFGRCSLTVALPVISAAGIETSVIPTAVLSTHTGGFTGYTFRDLTDDIINIAKHWNSLELHFDAIYTGFLGSMEQVDIVRKSIDLLRGENTIVVVDPVMADFGKLYSTFPEDFPLAMRGLCTDADLIVPNLTEAAFLTDEPYREGLFQKSEVADILKNLAALGPKRVVLTGVSLKDAPERIGAASLETNADAAPGASLAFSYASEARIDPMYHGTGDVFASVLVAALVRGMNLANASEAAVKFTVDCIRRTKAAATDNRFGVDFESGLKDLSSLLKL